MQNEHILGRKNSKVKLILYGEINSLSFRNFYQTLLPLLSNYSSYSVFIRYSNYDENLEKNNLNNNFNNNNININDNNNNINNNNLNNNKNDLNNKNNNKNNNLNNLNNLYNEEEELDEGEEDIIEEIGERIALQGYGIELALNNINYHFIDDLNDENNFNNQFDDFNEEIFIGNEEEINSIFFDVIHTFPNNTSLSRSDLFRSFFILFIYFIIFYYFLFFILFIYYDILI